MSRPRISAPIQKRARLHFLLTGLSCLAVALSISCSRKVSSQPDLSTASIVLKRTACYGTCPVYTVTLHGNRLIEYVGEKNVDIPGPRSKVVSSEGLRDVIRMSDDIRFWSLKDSYYEGCTDQPTAIITISFKGKSKEISNNFGGCLRQTAGPQVDLAKLAQEIDRASGAEEWIHCDNACLKKLIQSGLDVNVGAPDGTSLLILAVGGRDPERVGLLLDAGANVNVLDPHFGTTSLMNATIENNVDIVRELLAHGANVNAREKKRGFTALQMAGGKEVRKLLIEAKHN
jgi:hypothetical protein